MSSFFLVLPPQLRRAFYQQLRQQVFQVKVSYTTLQLPQVQTWTSIPLYRSFATSKRMADLSIGLTAPNGRKYTQPTGLFINNEWVKSSDGKTITSINPTFVQFQVPGIQITDFLAMKLRSPLCNLPQSPMSTRRWQQHEKLSKTRPGAICLPPTAETFC